MKKAERIARYGEAEYERYLAQKRAWYKAHKEEECARSKEYREAHKEETKARKKEYREDHPEMAAACDQEKSRKGGKHYDKMLEHQRTGIPGEKKRIRSKHRHQYKPYKAIIAPESQIHHEWIPDTSEYRGIALVEKEPHQYGIVDVIEILDGNITLLTEEEIKRAANLFSPFYFSCDT